MRQFDGANDVISFGSDASVDNFNLKSMLGWIRTNLPAATTDKLLTKSDGGVAVLQGWESDARTVADTGHLGFRQGFSATPGEWVTPDNSLQAAPGFDHVAIVYDRGSSANDPDMYINGTLQAEVEVTPPVGGSVNDGPRNLKLGEDDVGGGDFDGFFGWLVYDNTLFTAADVNRHKYWGVAPGGPSTCDVWHPMWTTDLTNKGTATANGTATGTTVSNVEIPRVERMWGSMMGCGR